MQRACLEKVSESQLNTSRKPEKIWNIPSFYSKISVGGSLGKLLSQWIRDISSFLPANICVTLDGCTSKKLRVVFHASAETISGLSLNECLIVGPKLRDDIFNIHLGFECFKLAGSAEVGKMYWEMALAKEDNFTFHRFFWRFDNKQFLNTYCLTGCTHDITNSSCHSIQSLTVQTAKTFHYRYIRELEEIFTALKTWQAQTYLCFDLKHCN